MFKRWRARRAHLRSTKACIGFLLQGFQQDLYGYGFTRGLYNGYPGYRNVSRQFSDEGKAPEFAAVTVVSTVLVKEIDAMDVQ